MVFSSQVFLFLFLPLALLLYYGARLGPRWLSHGVLVLTSLVFYGWSNPHFVLLLLLSTAVDFACGAFVARSQPGATAAPGELPLCPPGGPRVSCCHPKAPCQGRQYRADAG
jgi:alginate O-acetyltransferase complex protein AlgI